MSLTEQLEIIRRYGHPPIPEREPLPVTVTYPDGLTMSCDERNARADAQLVEGGWLDRHEAGLASGESSTAYGRAEDSSQAGDQHRPAHHNPDGLVERKVGNGQH